MMNTPPEMYPYELRDRYEKSSGRIFLTGTQALTRILMDQARRDRAAGLNTGGFVSGYRGSPLGALDLELWRANKELDALGIKFLPAVNEDLAATAVFGSQQVEIDPNKTVDGVFSMWYGKGPGVDRSGDALKHGNAYGSSPTGGVLVVAGDDHGCVSSSMSHQSDVAFMSWFMPVLNPASVAEYLEYGEYGYALSRYSGTWVGFKAISETVESALSVELRASRKFVAPDHVMPAGGLHLRWPDLPSPEIEERLEHKKHAVFAFAEANPIDRVIFATKNASFGIVTTGKGHLDLMEALRLLDIDQKTCRRLGIEIYKVGMVWPLSRRDALDFVRSKREVLVIEEKRGIIESQLKEYLYDWPGHKPERMVGKHDGKGNRLVPWTGELSPRQLAPLVAARLHGIFPDEGFLKRAKKLTSTPPILLSTLLSGGQRTPYFCSGCPHNTSTKVPDGSRALAGIGCHVMASWMDRNTSSLIQMGGEGVNWAASSKFTGNGHVFQNLGEGTWYHSGSMAIRQAIAAGTNITYKILFNDAVAMTGGQPVDGPISVMAIANICRAEGVKRIALVSDDPTKFSASDFPAGVTIDHRRDLDRVQRGLRVEKGVSVLIYEQVCAAEKRRRRKRGLLDDPARFTMINPLVCEGCGDCSLQSNCLSVEPLETEFGRKRQINLSSCNKDFTCLDGFCPSFVTINGKRRKHSASEGQKAIALAQALPRPAIKPLTGPYDLLITGVGGTGVVTVGALVAMAAHLQNMGAGVLDFTGFSQKFGAVLSFVRLGPTPDAVNQVRIDTRAANAVIGCDIVVSSSPKASATYDRHTKIVLNSARMPTGDLVRNRDASLDLDTRANAITKVVGEGNLSILDANALAETLLGDAVFSNVMMLGFAWQKGLVPISQAALLRAIELNGVAIDANKAAFASGRVMAQTPEALGNGVATQPPARPSLDQLIATRAAFLTSYQNADYADLYKSRIAGFQGNLKSDDIEEFVRAVAISLFRLMSYKDEYEVARLHRDPGFEKLLHDTFAPGFKVNYHLAPPLISRSNDAMGRPRKRRFGSWMATGFQVLAAMKPLRGTKLDPFGQTSERRVERDLIRWYCEIMDQASDELSDKTSQAWLEILSAPLDIRGYGPVKRDAIKTVKIRVARMIKEAR